MRQNGSSANAGRPSAAQGGRKRKPHRLIALLILIGLVLCGAAGYWGYQRYLSEQKRIAEERARQEQEERARQEALRLQREIKARFDAMLQEMERLLAQGRYDELRKKIAEARAFAAQHGLSTEGIDSIVARMELAIGKARLAELERLAEDDFAFRYVREGAQGLVRIAQLRSRAQALIVRTYGMEYRVCLHLSESAAGDGAAGRNPELNYGLSKHFLARAVSVREQYGVAADRARERLLLNTQNAVFFGQKALTSSSIPAGLY